MNNQLTLSDNNLSMSISTIPEIKALQIEHLTFKFDFRKSEALFTSGIYIKYKSAIEIFVILQEGRALGFTSSEAMQGLYIVQGGVQMYGSAKTSYLTKRGYRIQYKDEVIENNQLVKSTVVVTKDDESYEATTTIDQIKGGRLSPGFKNAPLTKLRYESINRIIKTQLAGIIPEIVGRSEDDFGIETKRETIQAVKIASTDERSALQIFIEDDCKSLEFLLKIKSQIKTSEEQKAFDEKFKWYQTKVKTTFKPALKVIQSQNDDKYNDEDDN